MPSQLGILRWLRIVTPRTTTSSPRHRYWDEAWWNEPQDLSRFNGMTTQQIAVKLRAEFADLRKSLSHTE